MQINGSPPANIFGTKTAGASPAPVKAKEEDPVDAFMKFQKMSPAEKIRDSILKKMGLTEEQLASMPPELRAETEKQIADEIKKSVEAGLAEKGLVVNLEA